MYAVVIESYGKFGEIVPCGNDGLQKLRNKTPRGWKYETECLCKKTFGEVYVIPDFTQAMCEMNNGKLVDTIRKVAIYRLK